MKQKENLIEQKKQLEAELEKIQKKIDRLPTSRLHLLRGLCNDKQNIFNKIKSLDYLIKTNEW